MHITDRISKKTAFHRFGLGSLELTVVSDGHILFHPAQPLVAPGIENSQFRELLRDYFLPEEYIDIAMNVLVIKSHDRVILIDSGAGQTMGERSGWLTESLKIAGFRPEDITDILLTHAHSDHIGGITTMDGQLVFPNADVYMTQKEYDYWMAEKIDLSKSKLTDQEGFAAFSVAIIKRTVEALGNRLHLLQDNAGLFGLVQLVPAAGHTPGHTAFLITSGGEHLFHMGDIVHSHSVLFAHPEWGFEADYDFTVGVATRQKILARLAESRELVFAFHLPFPGLGHVRRKGKGFEWQPNAYTSFAAADFVYQHN
jgi:glyoxylase-like metal-dependent hydrolase (beta-lactamase superfamily II)